MPTPNSIIRLCVYRSAYGTEGTIYNEKRMTVVVIQRWKKYLMFKSKICSDISSSFYSKLCDRCSFTHSMYTTAYTKIHSYSNTVVEHC